jgi:hypothetical protein
VDGTETPWVAEGKARHPPYDKRTGGSGGEGSLCRAIRGSTR